MENRSLPSALVSRIVKQYVFCFFLCAVCVIGCLVGKSLTYFVFLLPATYFFYEGFSLSALWKKNKIFSEQVVCVGAIIKMGVSLKKQTRVVFKDETGTFYEFLIAGVQDFSKDAEYHIYLKNRESHDLLAWSLC